MIKFADVPNILIVGTLVHFTPRPGSKEPDKVEMSVDGYETDVMILLSELRWSWTGWALLNDIHRKRDKNMLIIPWNELPFIDPASPTVYSGFNATSQSATLPKLIQGEADYGEIKKAALTASSGALVRYNPGMWNAQDLTAAHFLAKPADFKQAPGILKDEILLHEMVHGLRQMRNTQDRTRLNGYAGDVEEFIAIVVSNMYRSEKHRPGLRKDHGLFTPYSPELEDPQTFVDASITPGGVTHRSLMLEFKGQNPDFFNDLKRSPAAFNPFKLFD